MPWGRVEDDLHDNGKVATLSDRAFRVWWYSVSYCNKKRLDDPEGHLSRTEAVDLCQRHRARPLTAKGVASVIRELSEPTEDRDGVFWEPCGKGFIVHDFPQYGPKLDQTAAERQRNHRDKSRNVTRDSHGKDGVTRMHARPEPVPGPVPVPGAATTSEHQPEKATPEEEHTPPGERALALRDQGEVDFDRFWAAYPRREGKHAARASYQKRRKAGRSAEALERAAANYAERFEREGGELRYVKLPATFLNQECDVEWENGPPIPPTVPTRPGGRHPGATVLERNLANLAAITPGGGW